MTHSHKMICILPEKFGLGGPSSFQVNLIRVLEKRGVGVCHDPLAPGISSILVIGGTRHIAQLRQAQRRGIPVVQRLNGMNWVHRRKYTGVKHFLKAEWGNLLLTTIRNLADQVIYQSEFARGWWEREKGLLSTPNTVIHNGVDLIKFFPPAEVLPDEGINLLMVEGHHGGGYDQGLLTGAEMTASLHTKLKKPVTLSVVGSVPERLKRRAESLGRQIRWLGVVEHARIPEIDREAHLLYSADVNAACPNSVIEALACGLPVVGFNTGSLSELVTGDSGRIAPYGVNVWKLEKPDISGLVTGAEEILLERERFSFAARKNAVQHFDVEQMTDRYLALLIKD